MRKPWYYFQAIALTNFMIVSSAGVIFTMPFDPYRFELLFGLFTATVANKFAVKDDIPQTQYTHPLGKLLMAGQIGLFACIIESAVGLILESRFDLANFPTADAVPLANYLTTDNDGADTFELAFGSSDSCCGCTGTSTSSSRSSTTTKRATQCRLALRTNSGPGSGTF